MFRLVSCRCLVVVLVVCGVIRFEQAVATETDSPSVQSQNEAFRSLDPALRKTFWCSKAVNDSLSQAVRSSPENAQEILPTNVMEAVLRAMRDRSGSQLNDAALKQLQAQQIAQQGSASQGDSPQAETQRQWMAIAAKVNTPPAPIPVFMSRVSARIEIRNEVPGLCDSRCEADIEWNVIGAVMLWRAICVQCSNDFFTVISIGPRHWVDVRVLEWLRAPGEKSAADFPLFHSEGSVTARSMKVTLHPASPSSADGPGDSGSSGPGSFYDLIDPSDPAITQLCKTSQDADADHPGFHALRQALCTQSTSADAMMSVSLLPGDTSCGGAASILACGTTANGIELTFDQTRYSFLDVFGNKSVSVGPSGVMPVSGTMVLWHEVGHWFGLGHILGNPRAAKIAPELLHSVPDIMQDTYQDKPCLSSLSMALVSNLTEEEYAHRLTTGGTGLRRATAVHTH